MAVPPYPGTVHRVPIFQIMLRGAPFVCTNAELGEIYTRPLAPLHVWSCLGSLWAEQYQPDMQPIYRWTRSALEIGPGAQHCRLGGPDQPHWLQYQREAAPLGWAFAQGTRGEVPYQPWREGDELIDVNAVQLIRTSTNGGFFYVTGMEVYPGSGVSTPEPFRDEGGLMRIHAPQVVRVQYDHEHHAISMSPDPVVVTRGGGAPIVFLRGNGMNGSGLSMEWSFADLVLEETGQHPAGSTYSSSADLIVRHMSPSQIIVIDEIMLQAGEPARDTSYRLSIQDHMVQLDGRQGVVYSRDPKVRNGTGVGSGEAPPPSSGG